MTAAVSSIYDAHIDRRTTGAIRRLFIIACLTLSSAGIRAAGLERPIDDTRTAELQVVETSIPAETAAELHRYLLGREANVDMFRARGPFAVTTQQDRELRLTSSRRIKTDVFLSAPAAKAPLVLFLHGHDSSKRAHANQAAHLASWGMHCLTVQLPNNGPWDSNGRTLAALVRLIHRTPGAIDNRIDTSKIILVGHSFGAFAVAVALAEGAPAAGAILLDPATVGKDARNVLRRIQKPVMVLGADDEDIAPRNRDYFYEFIRSDVAEVSIRDAVHEDAQYPSEFALQNSGVDPHTTEELQITFVSALTAAAISISATGAVEYAWTSFRRVLQAGEFFNAKKK
ncbi:MAG: Chlorophyllase enzyme [Betaproteobacteria bacterium]|jgi:pimeloyl-ACP methyl ester carboxylesterase